MYIAALIDRLQAVRQQPCAQSDVLSISLLGRGDFPAVEIFRLLNPGISTDNQGGATAGGAGNDTQCLTVRANIALNRGIRTHIGHIDGPREQGFDGRRPGIKGLPFDLDPRT